MVEIVAEVEVRPTEDLDKVKKALSTAISVTDFVVEEIAAGYRVVRAKCTSVECLEPLRNAIKAQQIGPAVRSYLHKHWRGGALTILMHKQAAYAGKVSLVDSERESPLGPIRIEVLGTEEEVNGVVEYLTGE